jgi:hypothetical protein
LRIALACLLLLGCATPAAEKGGLLVSFAPAGITDAAVRERHALIVGIDAFDDARFGRLRFAAADARALAAALPDWEDVQVLTRPEQTTRAAILDALAALEHRIRGPRDTVLLYFSTHGSLAQTSGGQLHRYLVAADTRMDVLAETGLPVEALSRHLDSMASKRVALVLASCHSGRGKSVLPDPLAQAFAARKGPPRLDEVSEAVVLLTAAAFGEAAREDEKLGHDIYTYFFLEAFEKGDRDGDGAVTISEAHDYARERTYEFTGGAQRPTAESTMLGLDPIVLRGARRRAASPVVFSYAPSSEGLSVRLDGAVKGRLPGGVAFAPGPHELELVEARTGEQLLRTTVSLGAGERLDVSSLIPRPPRLRWESALGILAPLSRSARDALPLLGTLELGARVTELPWNDWSLTLSATLLGSVGQAAAFDRQLPYQLFGLGALASVSRELRAHRLAFSPSLGIGMVWLSRRVSASSFSSDESARGILLVPGARAGLAISDRFEIGLSASSPLLWADLEARAGPHLFASISLDTSFAF